MRIVAVSRPLLGAAVPMLWPVHERIHAPGMQNFCGLVLISLPKRLAIKLNPSHFHRLTEHCILGRSRPLAKSRQTFIHIDSKWMPSSDAIEPPGSAQRIHLNRVSSGFVSCSRQRQVKPRTTAKYYLETKHFGPEDGRKENLSDRVVL
jgi:hypothetical protein